MKKRLLALVLAAAMAVTALVGCGANPAESTGGEQSASETSKSENTPTEKVKLNFWYTHSGAEADAMEQAIASYNASQDKVEVSGLSVTDKQKIIVALSGSEAPDVIEVSNQDVLSYAHNGLLSSISDLAKADNYDMEALYSKQSLTANTVDGTLYGSPLASMVIQMFYNKDILAEIGYDAPPKTMDELYTMAVKATQVDENGTISRLGYPLFPLASARQELIYAFGGRWWAEDGTTLTPDDEGVLDSLKMNVEYRSKYGIQKVNEFVATANTNRYTENDMFFAGKQLFRFDGTWLAAMIEEFNSDVNYGVALIPSNDEKGMGQSRYETNSIAIPVVSQNQEAAWDFVKYLTNSEATKQFLLDIANLPALLSLYEDADILAMPNYDIFIEALKQENGIQYATIEDLSQYTTMINEYLDYVYNGSKTPEEAMSELKEQAANLR